MSNSVGHPLILYILSYKLANSTKLCGKPCNYDHVRYYTRNFIGGQCNFCLTLCGNGTWCCIKACFIDVWVRVCLCIGANFCKTQRFLLQRLGKICRL